MPLPTSSIPTLDKILEQAIDNVCKTDLNRFKNANFLLTGKSDEEIVRMIKSASTGNTAPTYPIAMESMRLVLHKALELAAEQATLSVTKGEKHANAIAYNYRPPDPEEHTRIVVNKQAILDIEKLFI